MLAVSGTLASGVTVSDGATLAGGGTVGAISFGGASLFDISLALVGNALNSSTGTISFSASGFGIEQPAFLQWCSVDWESVPNNTYTLINGTLDEANLAHFGVANAYDLGGGRSAYFEESGGLDLVVVPEPTTTAFGLLAMGGLAAAPPPRLSGCEKFAGGFWIVPRHGSPTGVLGDSPVGRFWGEERMRMNPKHRQSVECGGNRSEAEIVGHFLLLNSADNGGTNATPLWHAGRSRQRVGRVRPRTSWAKPKRCRADACHRSPKAGSHRTKDRQCVECGGK